MKKVFRYTLLSCLVSTALMTAPSANAAGSGHSLSDQVIPVPEDTFPERPKLLIEWGEDYLASGKLSKSFTLPTGAVWRPALWAFGTYRTAVQHFEVNDVASDEWVHRLDLFANLRLTGTERVLLGVRPLDRDRSDFTRYIITPDVEDKWVDNTNFALDTAFFEGDLGELFPGLDGNDKRAFDISMVVGRQPVNYQGGALINDTMDAIGFSRNNIQFGSVINFRSSILFSNNEINLGDGSNTLLDSGGLVGWFNEADFYKTTVNADFAFVTSDESPDTIHAGFSAAQRFGLTNTNFRALFSSLDEEEPNPLGLTDGNLFTAEFSYAPRGTYDLSYINLFYGNNGYSQAALSPDAGGPLASVGILFAAVGMGSYGSAIGNSVDDAYGLALGRQWQFNHGRTQFILEGATKQEKGEDGLNDSAIGVRYQQAFGRRYILQLDAFQGFTETENFDRQGARIEFRAKL